MKILRFEAVNMKRLRFVDITPTSDVVRVCGPNGAGKSTVLDCVVWGFKGKRAIDAQPIRAGEDEGHIRLTLGDAGEATHILTRTFNGNDTELIIESPEGARFAKPQLTAESLVNAVSIDPVAFLRMAPKEQAEVLGELVGLRDGLRDMADERARLYAERTEVNRERKRLEGAVSSIIVNDERAAPVDVAYLMQAIEDANDEARIESDMETIVGNVSGQLSSVREKLEKLRATLAEGERREAQLVAELAQREQDLAAHRTRPAVDVDALRERMQRAQAINADVEKRERRDQLRRQLSEQDHAANELTDAIAFLDKSQEELIAAAPMPVPGLGFGADGITYLGVPFEQASTAERLKVSCAIGMSQKPQLSVMVIKDGSLLDESSQRVVEEMAAERGYQVWIEFVDTHSNDHVAIEDGTARVVAG